ncbi:unnamed protein product [Scytosiphon promiscuus]
MPSTRRKGSCRSSNARSTRASALSKLSMLVLSCVLFAVLMCTTPATAFIVSPRSACAVRSADRADGLAPLFGIKRKVKAEIEENYSGKVVEPAGAASSMFGSDANTLFDVIEKNKKKAAEAAAAVALGAGDADGNGEGEGEGEEGGRREGEDEGDAAVSGEAA